MRKINIGIAGMIAAALCGTILTIGSAAVNPAAAMSVQKTMPTPPDRVASLRLNTARVGNVPALLRQSALIVRVHPLDRKPEAHATGRKVASGAKIKHYVQRLHVQETMRGRAPAELRLVLPGIEPPPPAKDPLNLTYPGPLADDEAYVLFLQPTGLTGIYTTVGGWQGIYPIGDDGRTVALASGGFSELGGLTPSELRARIRAAATPR